MSFLLDKEFSEKYEEHFAKVTGLNWNKCDCDDCGVDLCNNDRSIIIDVKCYAAPQLVKHFTGAFIETHLPRSNRPGWLYDDKKLTTHYILVQDCSRDEVDYFKAWYISRYALRVAIRDAGDKRDLTEKCLNSASGYILPYKYLDKYCDKCWYYNGGKLRIA